MGLFSNSDINEAELLVSKAWNKELRTEFLRGFEESYKWTKKASSKEISAKAQEFLTEVIKHDYTEREDYEKNRYLIRNFGHMFGTLISLFKYRPTLILQDDAQYLNRLCVLFIKQLKQKSPEHYAFISKRILLWAKKIKANPKELATTHMNDAFLKFLKSV